MNRRQRIALGLSSTLVLGATGAGIAGAAKSGSQPAGPGGGPPGAAAIATYLGLSSADLQSALAGGKTLAQVATAQGKTVAGLEAAMVADAKTHLDAEVTAGTLTAAQEATMLANLQAHVDELVNSTGRPAGGRHGPGALGSAAVADYLGLTATELRADLQSGKTLAQIASAQGKTAAGLEAAMLADAKSHLDADVTSGKLTAAQEQTMLANVQSHIDGVVNSTGPPAGGRPAGGPPRVPGAAATGGGIGSIA